MTSIARTVNISCPSCGAQQEVELYDAINVETDPHLKDALMHNSLNRVECVECESCFRVDMPLLYNDPGKKILIHWVPEVGEVTREQILDDFERSIGEAARGVPEGVEIPSIRLVMTRVELVELIYMIEAGMNQRVVEYVKYTIYTRNMEKVDPQKFRLLLSVEDSKEDELFFVVQDVEDRTLGQVLRYGRAAYQSMCDLYDETPEEFIEMFPGPSISARYLLLEDGEGE